MAREANPAQNIGFHHDRDNTDEIRRIGRSQRRSPISPVSTVLVPPDTVTMAGSSKRHRFLPVDHHLAHLRHGTRAL